MYANNAILQFPAHLRDHPELPAEEKERYQSQYQSISKMIALFDDPGYKDDDPRVVELMTEVRAHPVCCIR
jgi:peroxin-19